jgi:ribosomal protein S1/(E)-4-hydroxy-3-methyl-but-2-enyl pyrophosphate reductase
MIDVASSAGFCFGVSRGVDMVYDLLAQGKKVVTLGPIIHNKQLVDKLLQEGVRIVDSPSEVSGDEILVVRSHGVAKNIYDQINDLNINFSDATCPFVSKIHKIVSEISGEDSIVLIAGDPVHPEVIGIMGHCNSPAFAFNSQEELEKISKGIDFSLKKSVVLVAQTTFNTNLWEIFKENAKKLYTKVKIFDTICNATEKRQADAHHLALKSDLMIVVGGRHSSNTAKLKEVCEKFCDTILIETKGELFENKEKLLASSKIGLTAGASTPAYIIKEVLLTMSEILSNQENELNFEELLEQSLNLSEKIYAGKRVTGIVIAIAPNEIQVDVGAKQAGFVPIDELTDDPNLKAFDIVKVGDELTLMVTKVNDQEGIMMLSKKRCDLDAGFETIKKAFEEGTILNGVVVEILQSGVLVLTNSVKVFVPASHVSLRRVEDLNTLYKTNVSIKIIDVNEERRRSVGSIKVVEKEARAGLEAEIWAKLEVGQVHKGEVRSITAYGAFVDLGGVDGMVHISELSWSKIKHPTDVVKTGDIIEVYIKSLDAEKKKISLGYKKVDDNPWEKFANDNSEGQTVSVKIVSIAEFGAFAEIVPGIDGLIHISQIANEKISKVTDRLKVGDVVDAKITEIDRERKRISLSIRALLEEQESAEQKENAEAVENLDNVELTAE